MSRKFLIITGFFSFLALFVQWGFTGFSGLIGGIFQILSCGLIASLIVRMLRGKDISFRANFIRSTLVFASVIGFFSGILLLFIAYQNTFPAAVGKVILTNGDKNIVVYQMSHIATPAFYAQVKNGITELAASGYTIYAEGVRPGTPENQERFDKLLGIKMTKTLYENFSSLFGLISQDDSIYAEVATGSLQNVDISLDDIMNLIGTGAVVPESSPIDLEAEIAQLDASERGVLLAPFMRSMLNFFLRNNSSLDSLASGFSPEVFDVILHDRNAFIVKTLEADTQKNIVLVYGAMHFQGIYDLLKTHDPKWKILSVESLYPYSF
ncbi:MAG: hypothetical protein PHY14_05025 [Candidatus Gracilibacteria bacterium]|nr:hypothetical protein [Candidatus Gracilibacteria bacterium]